MNNYIILFQIIEAYSVSITDSNMETVLQLGSLLLHIGSQMMDPTRSNKDPSYKAVSIFETVIFKSLSVLLQLRLII